MRKVNLMMLLAVFSNSALAEWVEVMKAPGSGYVLYADPSTIRKHSDNTAEIMELRDFEKPLEKSGGFFSKKQTTWSATSLLELNCEGLQFRHAKFTEHSEKMGKGEIVATKSLDNKWISTGTNYSGYHLLLMASCAEDPSTAFNQIINQWGSPLGDRIEASGKLQNYRNSFKRAKTVDEWNLFIANCKTFDPDNLLPQAEKALAAARERKMAEDAVAREKKAAEDAAQRELVAALRARNLQTVKQIGQKICKTIDGTEQGPLGAVYEQQFLLTAFTENAVGSKVQLRIAGIKRRDTSRIIGGSNNVDYLNGDIVLRPNSVIWDDPSLWHPCD